MACGLKTQPLPFRVTRGGNMRLLFLLERAPRTRRKAAGQRSLHAVDAQRVLPDDGRAPCQAHG